MLRAIIYGRTILLPTDIATLHRPWSAQGIDLAMLARDAANRQDQYEVAAACGGTSRGSWRRAYNLASGREGFSIDGNTQWVRYLMQKFPVTLDPADVLRSGSGDCRSLSVALACWLYLMGEPVACAWGRRGENWHAWVRWYDGAQWIDLDPSGSLADTPSQIADEWDAEMVAPVDGVPSPINAMMRACKPPTMNPLGCGVIDVAPRATGIELAPRELILNATERNALKPWDRESPGERYCYGSAVVIADATGQLRLARAPVEADTAFDWSPALAAAARAYLTVPGLFLLIWPQFGDQEYIPSVGWVHYTHAHQDVAASNASTRSSMWQWAGPAVRRRTPNAIASTLPDVVRVELSTSIWRADRSCTSNPSSLEGWIVWRDGAPPSSLPAKGTIIERTMSTPPEGPPEIQGVPGWRFVQPFGSPAEAYWQFVGIDWNWPPPPSVVYCRRADALYHQTALPDRPMFDGQCTTGLFREGRDKEPFDFFKFVFGAILTAVGVALPGARPAIASAGRAALDTIQRIDRAIKTANAPPPPAPHAATISAEQAAVIMSDIEATPDGGPPDLPGSGWSLDTAAGGGQDVLADVSRAIGSVPAPLLLGLAAAAGLALTRR